MSWLKLTFCSSRTCLCFVFWESMFDEINLLIMLLIMQRGSHKTKWYYSLFVTNCYLLDLQHYLLNWQILCHPWGNSNNLPIDYWAASFSKKMRSQGVHGEGQDFTSLYQLWYPFEDEACFNCMFFWLSSLHMVGCPKMHCVSGCPARHWSFIYSFWMPSSPLLLRII